MFPFIDHIHITVNDLKRAEQFYDKLMPILGYDLSLKEYTSVPEHEYELIEYHHKLLSFGLISPRVQFSNEIVNRRKPGSLHHLAFLAGSNTEVEKIYDGIKSIGAEIISEPQFHPEYCPDYYAFFFKDSEGIELEILHFNRAHYFR